MAVRIIWAHPSYCNYRIHLGRGYRLQSTLLLRMRRTVTEVPVVVNYPNSEQSLDMELSFKFE